MTASLTLGAVIITKGDRPDDPRALLGPAAARRGGRAGASVVGAGTPVTGSGGLPPGARTVGPPGNPGTPGGRTAGTGASGPAGSGAPLVPDGDGLPPDPAGPAEPAREALAADPEPGVLPFRIAGEATGRARPRRLPRLRAADPTRSSRVTAFPGAARTRTPVIAEAGPPSGEFLRAHEGTGLARRAPDAGRMPGHRSDLPLSRPTTAPFRHAVHHRTAARDRVRPARRNPPAPLVPRCPGVRVLLTLARRPPPAAPAAREGRRTPCGPRRPMKWRTVRRLTRLGRPPVI
ncbi:glycosyltransferase family 2 protein [Streptomyces sp. NPDC001985]|uniref:glycosyltransferase family 2 protein n=1 Tax=Streptomyces sp. NPDC001985 TaxID=3154406 RepID=UPI003325CA18